MSGNHNEQTNESVGTQLKMVSGYWTTKGLCERFKCSSRSISRSISRWVSREKNAFPKPRIKGCYNMWAIDDVVDWENSQSE